METETLPEDLSRAGYQTFAVGKLHLGNAKKEYWPPRRGSKRYYGYMSGKENYFERNIAGRHYWRIEDQAIWPTMYSINLLPERSQE